ncbi:MAG TPA: hypothetical protein DEH78_00585 [Solibacterales bacterium]|nr:hypothetical protein [Bryobacterales bacterium]
MKWTANTAVTWSLSSTTGTVDATGLYRAPAAVAGVTSVTATARSAADPARFATATISVSPTVTVGLSPQTVSLYAAKTQQFVASVSGVTNTSVSWSVSPQVGTITSAGLYTAPSAVSAAQQVTIKATSAADGTKSASAVVTLQPPIAVSVAPASVSVAPGGSVQLSAVVANAANNGVSWSLSPAVGTVNGSGLYTAPAVVAATQTVSVTATSAADATKKASSLVTVTAPPPKSSSTPIATFKLKESFGVGHPEQVVAFDYASPFNPATTVLTGPNGVEVAYQVVDGKILVRTHLGRSTVPYAIVADNVDATLNDTLSNPSPMYLENGMAVTLTGYTNPLPVGLTAGTKYFVVNKNGPTYQISASYGGPPVAFSGQTGGIVVENAGPVADAASDLIVWGEHNLQTGDPLALSTTGTLPKPLAPKVTYYAIRGDANRFKLALSRAAAMAGQAIDLTDAGSGLHRVEIEWTWTLSQGVPAATTAGAVTVNSSNPAYFEITNGLTGVRVARPTGDLRMAPIQGIRLRNGVWTATGPNYLHSRKDEVYKPPVMTAKTMQTTILESGPMQVKVRVAYTFDKPAAYENSVIIHPAGPGYYTSTLVVQANQPVVMIEEENDADVEYLLNVYPQIQPNRGRQVGRSATPLGSIRDLQYTRPLFPSDSTRTANNMEFVRRMMGWHQWSDDTGWTWTLYNTAAGPSGQSLSIFAGPVSRAWAADSNGVGIFTNPNDPATGKAAGFWFRGYRGKPSTYVRVAWGLYAGTNAELPESGGNMAGLRRLINLHSGINLAKIARFPVAYADPPNGWNPLYMSRETYLDLVNRVRTDKAYFDRLFSSALTSRDLLRLWADTTGKMMWVTTLEVDRLTTAALNSLVNGDGVYATGLSYFAGAKLFASTTERIAAVLLDDRATAEQKERVKAAAVVYAWIVHDNDYAPMFEGHRLSMGTANMPTQMLQSMDAFKVFLAHHPQMSALVQSATDRALFSLDATVNSDGAQMGSTYYAGAAMGPLLDSFQQLQVAGSYDGFVNSDRLKRFGEFLLNFLTPPEPRFDGLRKQVAIGDAPTTASQLFPQLATGFATSDPTLSRRLMGAWRESGAPADQLSVTKFDPDLPSAPVGLKSATFDGWYSVLRHGYASPNETAVWHVNGMFYRDHSHAADYNSVAIYALGSPVSLHWGSVYSPHTGSHFLHNTVVREVDFTTPWYQDNFPLFENSRNSGTTTRKDFQAFTHSSRSVATFASTPFDWTRTVDLIQANPAFPIIALRDTFAGIDAQAPKVLMLNLMADGAVSTPSGPVTPPLRSYIGSLQQLPSAVPIVLPAGLPKLGFKGQWTTDWDVYLATDGATEATLGNWAHGWHPTPEANQYRKVTGKSFEERQHILRVESANSFRTYILPYRKGQPRAGQAVVRDGQNLKVTAPGEETILAPSYYTFKDAQKTVVAALESSPVAALGVSISGGPAEVVISSSGILITVHGPAGTRTINLGALGTRTVNYAGGDPVTVTF